jgi:hypothetical protein
MLNTSSKAFEVALNVTLICLCLLSYALLILLFVDSQVLHIRSLVIVVPGEIKPAVAISLLAALLTASTSALVTRCVEQSLWLKLNPGYPDRKLTVGESHRLAQWSVSPLARLSYLLYGHSWMLKFGGIFLLSTAAVGPVLVSGVSQREFTHVVRSSETQSRSPFSGFLNTANTLYNGGNYKDVPMMIAAVTSMNNLSAPSASVCDDGSCSVTTQFASIRADCSSTETPNPRNIGGTGSGSSISSTNFCSSLNPKICRALVSSSPATYTNFTTGPSGKTGCDPSIASSSTCPPGSWATLFGVWVNDGAGTSSSGPGAIKTVDCALTYGNVTVRQEGTGTPILDRTSFVQSTYSWSSYATGQWQRIYIETGNKGDGTNDGGDAGVTPAPYCFSGRVSGTGANTLFKDPIGPSLLGDHAGDAADVVARRIERNFDMATLFAFARVPQASRLEFEETTQTPGWVYDWKVLLVLLVPLIASVLGIFGRWKVTGKDINVGYDPVEIAGRGPVLMADGSKNAQDFQSKESKNLRVWGVDANTYHTGIGKSQFSVGK